MDAAADNCERIKVHVSGDVEISESLCISCHECHHRPDEAMFNAVQR